MKALILSIFSLLVLSWAYGSESTQNKFRIEGQIENIEGWIYLEFASGGIDSTFVRGGKFIFEGNAPRDEFARIYQDKQWFVVLIADCLHIVVRGDARQAAKIKVTGSPSTARDYLAHKFSEIPNSADSRFDSIFTHYKGEVSRIVAENHDNMASVMTIKDNAFYLTGQEKLHNIALLAASMQQNADIQSIKNLADRQLQSSQGRPYIDFALPDSTGSQIRLSQVVGRNKYVLVDFWASWCGPCLKSIPQLKELYGKHHAQGFEIVSVSLDTKRDLWLKASDKYALDWLNVSALGGWTCPAAIGYGVESIPAIFLIDHKGTIVRTNAKLEELAKILSENL